MEMTMRWYGKEYDTVTLQQIRQSCYVKGIISTLYNKCRERYGNWMKSLH